MNLASPFIPGTRYRPGHSRLARLARSNSFAWGVSIGAHAAVFAVLYVAVFREVTGPKRVIIPEARLAPVSSSSEPPSRVPLKITQQPAPSLTVMTDPKLSELPIAAVDLDRPPEFVLPGEDQRPDTVAMTSVAMSMSAGPVSSFFGQSGNAYRVVYVVDLSASLMIYIGDIVGELRRSVGGLIPTQRFGIVLARPGRMVEEFKPGQLVWANRANKQEVSDFLEPLIGPQQAGPADPIKAMERALAAGPELIYFLSDGEYANEQAELLAMLKRSNADGAVKITTIGFDPSPKGAQGLLSARELLSQIAAQHGGHYREVKLTE